MDLKIPNSAIDSLSVIEPSELKYFSDEMLNVVRDTTYLQEGKHGLAVHAKRNIEAEEPVGYFIGPIIYTNFLDHGTKNPWSNMTFIGESTKLGNKCKEADYRLDYLGGAKYQVPGIGKTGPQRLFYVIDPRGPGRFFNHANARHYYWKKPPTDVVTANIHFTVTGEFRNGAFQPKIINGQEVPFLTYVTKRKIKINEELVFHYGGDYKGMIYFEYLRRSGETENPSSLESIKNQITAIWKENKDHFPENHDFEKHFFELYINAPEEILFPKTMSVLPEKPVGES